MVLRALTRGAVLVVVGCAATPNEPMAAAVVVPSAVEPVTPPTTSLETGDPRWQDAVANERVLAFPSVQCAESEIGVGFLSEAKLVTGASTLAVDVGCRWASEVVGVYCCPDSLSPPPIIPSTGGGQSCEEAIFAYVEALDLRSQGDPDAGLPDLTAGQYGAVLNRGNYFSHCRVPDDMGIAICAAIRDGRAEGVTVRTNPRDAVRAECVARAVRGLAFPSGRKLDVTRTTFQ